MTLATAAHVGAVGSRSASRASSLAPVVRDCRTSVLSTAWLRDSPHAKRAGLVQARCTAAGGSGRRLRCWPPCAVLLPASRCAPARRLLRSAHSACVCPRAGFAIGALGFVVHARAGVRASGQDGIGLGAALVARRVRELFALGLAGRGASRATASSPAASSAIAVAGRAVHVLSRRQDPRSRRSRTPAAARRSPAFASGCPPRRSGGSAASAAARAAASRGTRCCSRCRARSRCTALGLAFALIATRTRSRYKRALRVAVGAADHHAAVRDRARPDPALRPLRARQPVPRVRVRHRADALDLRLPGRAAGAGVRVHADRVPRADRRRRGRRRRRMEEAAQTLRADRWTTFTDRLAAADAARARQRVPDQLHRVDRRLRQPDRARRQLRRAVDRDLLLGRRRAARPGPRRDARHPAAGVRARRVRRCSAACSAARSTRRCPARAMPACRRRCPTACAACATPSRAVGRADARRSTRWRSPAASSRPGDATTRRRSSTT